MRCCSSPQKSVALAAVWCASSLCLVASAATVPLAHSDHHQQQQRSSSGKVSFRQVPLEVEPDSVHNIHVTYDHDNADLDGELSLVYGPCNLTSLPSFSSSADDEDEDEDHHHHIGSTHIGTHPLAARHADWDARRPSRFVWVTPSTLSSRSSSCLHAFLDGQHVGRSDDEVRVVKKRENKKRATFADVADPMGPWFDGVAYLRQKQPNETFVAATKSKRFGILGAGMAGLTTGLMLDSVGVHNWHILESSQRVGGRVRTSYLNNTQPHEGQYHEMGPMRFPVDITDEATNETYPINDQRMVFQLADKINALNAAAAAAAAADDHHDHDHDHEHDHDHDHDHTHENSTSSADAAHDHDHDHEHSHENRAVAAPPVIEFIPWIQSSPNTPVNTKKRRPDGTFPGKTEVNTLPQYYEDPAAAYTNATAAAEAVAALDAFKGLDDPARRKLLATDLFRAHKASLEEGLLDFSEVEYLRHAVGMTDLNTVDEVTPSYIAWPMWEYETVYFLAQNWVTVKGGLSQFTEAFRPLVGADRITHGAKVYSVVHHAENNSLSVSYRAPGVDPREAPTTTEEFDYVFNSVPFNLLKFWNELPPYSSLLRRAIDRTIFGGAVKVAIQYKSRWWEDPAREFRIEGGCGRVTEPGYLVGQICYPSWDINATAGTPGVLMASYISDYDATVACALSEAEHVAHVQRAIVAIHGDVAEREWTGHYERHCWEHDEHHAGAFALPIVPQQQLYLPAFFKTEFNTVFIGEHTSYTHSWVFSALESAARGTVQMLLDLGLVDEAKQVNEEWMARWIQV